MRLFRKKRQEEVLLDPQEHRLHAILELTRGLGRNEFNNLMDAVKLAFELRQKLRRVNTKEEKENDDIDKAESIFMEEK